MEKERDEEIEVSDRTRLPPSSDSQLTIRHKDHGGLVPPVLGLPLTSPQPDQSQQTPEPHQRRDDGQEDIGSKDEMREKVPLIQVGRLVLGIRSDGGSFFLVEQEVGLLVLEFFVGHHEGEM
jgi:hypothetical protein